MTSKGLWGIDDVVVHHSCVYTLMTGTTEQALRCQSPSWTYVRKFIPNVMVFNFIGTSS